MGQTSLVSAAVMSFGIGALLGWFRKHQQLVASGAAAGVLALAPASANAIVDYDAIKYLGGSDKVDINNANVQAYRQFPGMYPTAAGAIATHGPYSKVSDIYDIPGVEERVKDIMKSMKDNSCASHQIRPMSWTGSTMECTDEAGCCIKLLMPSTTSCVLPNKINEK